MGKTRNKNLRRKRRNGKNIFYLVLSTDKGSNCPLLFSRKPNKCQVIVYRDYYDEDWEWFSLHSTYYPPKEGVKHISVDKYTPVKVRLEICNEEPDMYIQRYKDCLFIGSRIHEYLCGGDGFSKTHYRVEHDYRISSKLFPEVTEESGIVGVKIVKY